MGVIQIEVHPQPFDRPYKILDLEVVENKELSLGAKGLHTYLVSRPPGWKIWESELISRSTNGRDSLRSKIRELEEAGYLKREQIRDGGKFSTVKFTVDYIPHRRLETRPRHRRLENRRRETQPHNNRTDNNNNHKTVSNETVIPDKSGFIEKPLRLRIKPRKKINNNGLLYDSSVAKRYKQIDLNVWNEHPLNKSNKYDPPAIALQEKIKLMGIKRPMVNEIKEVVDHWNENASQLSSNGHKLPSHRLDLNTKTSYMCKLIVTGILHTSNLTVEDIKKAIDNYRKVLENSHYYNHLYSFPQFYSKSIFNDCVEGNLSTYIKYKKKLTREDLLEIAKREHKIVRGGQVATYEEEGFYKYEIQEGRIKTEDDARKSAR